MNGKNDRLREAPVDRLATSISPFDLRAASAELWQEHGVSGHGHRQKVLARHGGVTVALFVFESGAGLAPHSTGGMVVIQCIDGGLEVSADDQPQQIGPGGVLVLAPRVRHGVRATSRTVMLLTVALQPDETST